MRTGIGPYSTATEMLGALRDKTISSAELIELHVQRIEERDGPLNANPVRTFDRLREAAERADRARAGGKRAAWRSGPRCRHDTPGDGSDLGGSIRVPAAYCGLYGHRPSQTAVSRAGAFPFGDFENPVIVGGVQGPLAPSAIGMELLFDVVAGPGHGENAA